MLCWFSSARNVFNDSAANVALVSAKPNGAEGSVNFHRFLGYKIYRVISVEFLGSGRIGMPRNGKTEAKLKKSECYMLNLDGFFYTRVGQSIRDARKYVP